MTYDSPTDVELGGTRYDWSIVPVDAAGEQGWAHSGATAAADGTFYFTDSSGSRLVALRSDGAVTKVDLPTVECHGFAADNRGGVWIADIGLKAYPARGSAGERSGEPAVLLVSPSGEVLRTLDRPGSEPWRPTGVAVHTFGEGTDGRIFVADGYGRSLVHCYSAEGELLWTSDGGDSGTVFDTPHGIAVDDRGDVPTIAVADRSNHRIVVLTTEGEFVRSFGSDELTSPSAFAVDGERLWVTELFGGLVVFGPSDEVVGRVSTPLLDRPEGWPNEIDAAAAPVAPAHMPGALRSPHGIAANASGQVLVTEWIIGGRLDLLTPIS